MSTDLKGELASLKIDRNRKAVSPWRWPLLLFVPVLLALGVLYGLRVRQALAAPEVEIVAAAVQTSEKGDAGTPVLSASGYVVARRKAVVSAKIQGRLSWLGVEEGSIVREGQVFARLESTDYEANVQRAKAAVQRAEADLGESQRQLRLAEDLTRQNIMGTDQRDATASRVRLAEASLAQARADVSFYEAQLANTQIRAPFSGVVVKKMAEVGESVAPIPPGVNISTASGAIVALADLDTLEVEVDVSESNVAKLGDEPAGRGRGRGLSRPPVQGGAAPGDSHRRPHQGHGAGQGHDPRQGQGPEARDERQGHVPRAREGEGERRRGSRRASFRSRRTRWPPATESPWSSSWCRARRRLDR